MNLSFIFIFDFFSFFFSRVVLVISSLIFLFGQYYMDSDSKQKGFCLLLASFVLSMLILIYSPSMFSLLLGWDGLGLTSYFLVVYYIRYSRSVAGILTFLINRVGDMFFILSIAMMFFIGSWTFFNLKNCSLCLGVFFLLTAIRKRAQIPFSSWLPAAMSAPTPVSSLVHSSTLVTAGIFILLRFENILVRVSWILLVISLGTMLIAGLCANFEWDLKKIIAFSTLSQLGFMMFSLRQGLVFFCFFHLLCHALFKAALFIVSGVIIHNIDSFQDFRSSFNFSYLGSLRVGVVVCVLCLCGFPFLSGFFSKDFILDSVRVSLFFFLLFLLSVLLTISYSIRFRFYVLKSILTKHSGFSFLYRTVNFVKFAVWCFVLMAVFLGRFWVELVSFYFIYFSYFANCWKSLYIFMVILLIFIFLLVLSIFINVLKLKKYFFSKIFFLNLIFNSLFFKHLFIKVGVQDKLVGQGWMETVGPQVFFSILRGFSSFLFRVEIYLFIVFVFIFSFFFLLFLWKYSLIFKSVALKKLWYILLFYSFLSFMASI